MGPGDRILVVEDDDDIRDTMQEMLVSEGFRVDVARDGLDALGKLAVEADLPLIILDMMMPRMDGETFLKVLRGKPTLADASVIVISGDAVKRQSAGALHAIACLVKPFELEELLGLIRGVPCPGVHQ